MRYRAAFWTDGQSEVVLTGPEHGDGARFATAVHRAAQLERQPFPTFNT